MKSGHWIVMCQYKRGPVEVYGGPDNTYDIGEDASEVAGALVTYEHNITTAWAEYVPSIDEELNPKNLGD